MKYTIKELIQELQKGDLSRNVFLENQDGVTDDIVLSFDDLGDVSLFEGC